jgi:peptidoglycan/LPS O-acetylase OafA/YrhL
MRTKFFQKFKRVTYSTSYLPEIDGLRFLAVFMVVVIMHITNYMNEKFFDAEWIQPGYVRGFVLGGGMGVSLFL